VKIDELCGRVWDAKREVLTVTAINIHGRDEVSIVVSRDDWRALMLENSRRPGGSPFWVEVDEGDRVPKCFGIPVVASLDLSDGQIRFRSEVAA
jgi:hypothetical protein